MQGACFADLDRGVASEPGGMDYTGKPMKNRFLITGFILLVLTLAFVTGCRQAGAGKNAPRAKAGVLDLRGWDLIQDGPVMLAGQWAFYWDRLLTPEAFEPGASSGQPAFINLPGSWNGRNIGNRRLGAQGHATYRLTVLLPEDRPGLAVKFRDIQTSCVLYIDGRKMVAQGRVGVSRETTVPWVLPRVVSFAPRGHEIQIVLQVANYHHRLGGAGLAIWFGSEQGVQELRERAIAFEMLLFGSILIMGCYHLGLYLLRRKDPSPLFFAVFCFLIALRVVTTGERYLIHLFPALGWELTTKVEYLTFYLSVPVFCRFIQSIFPKDASRWGQRVLEWVGVVFSFLVVLTPALIFTHTVSIYQGITLVAAVYGAQVLIRAVFHRREGARIFLTGFLVLAAATINDILHVQQMVFTGHFVPFGLFVFIFSQAFILSLRSSKAFSMVEVQKRVLAKTNDAFAREIRERRTAEKALKEAHERFLTVLDGVDADIYVADMETHEILLTNKHMQDSFGDDLMGRICWEVLRSGDGPCVDCSNSRLLDPQGQPAGVHIWEGLNPITGKWYLNSDRAIKWVDGRVVRLEVATDVTQQKLAEEALKQTKEALEKGVADRTAELARTNEELIHEIGERVRTEDALKQATLEAEQANLAKSEFLANMSHEIRTPLNGILGMLELINPDTLDARHRDVWATVEAESEALLGIINDILDFSKIEAGKVTLEAIPFNPATVVEGVIRSFTHQAEQKMLSLSARLSDDFPDTLVGDPGRLGQILKNLVGNALKFTHEGGVRIKGDVAETGDSMVAVRFQVTDTGIGILQEKQGEIFQSFTQADGSTTRKYGGTGLGITISKQLAQLMGGHMGLSSQPNKGSTFWFTAAFTRSPQSRPAPGLFAVSPVPAPKQKPAGAGSGEETTRDPDTAGRRILLVEDYPTNQRLAMAQLRGGGYAVDLAQDGRQAVEAFGQKTYDLILMDVQMPEMDGYEATRQIRALERQRAEEADHGFAKAFGPTHRIPIVAMTAHAVTGYRERCLEVGMDDYLTKPLRRVELLALVGKWIQNRPVEDGGADCGLPMNFDTALEEFFGQKDLLVEVLERFRQNVRQQLPVIQRAVVDNRPDIVSREAHAIKGGAANLTARRLSLAAGELEQMGHSGVLEKGPMLIRHLESEFNRLETYLARDDVDLFPERQ